MVSLNALNFLSQKQSIEKNSSIDPQTNPISYHKNWYDQNGWKNVLNNLRLIVKPTILLWLITPWLYIFPNPKLSLGFHLLIEANALVPTLFSFWIISSIYYFLNSESDKRGIISVCPLV